MYLLILLLMIFAVAVWFYTPPFSDLWIHDVTFWIFTPFSGPRDHYNVWSEIFSEYYDAINLADENEISEILIALRDRKTDCVKDMWVRKRVFGRMIKLHSETK